jgi:hypothetical protein
VARKKKCKVFVSYSRHDEALVKPLAGLLGAAVEDSIFLDVDSLKAGDHWSAEIEKAVRDSSVFFVCWCCESKKSTFVADEIRKALETGGKRLVPVLFCGTPLPTSLASRQWVDLRGRVVHSCDHILPAESEDAAQTADPANSSPIATHLSVFTNSREQTNRKWMWLSGCVAAGLFAVVSIRLVTQGEKPPLRPSPIVPYRTAQPNLMPPYPSAVTTVVVETPAVKSGKGKKKSSKHTPVKVIETTTNSSYYRYYPNLGYWNSSFDVAGSIVISDPVGLVAALAKANTPHDTFAFNQGRRGSTLAIVSARTTNLTDPWQALAAMQAVLIAMSVITAMAFRALDWLERRPTNEIVNIATDYFEGLKQV